jgi:hypothetical protein
MRLIVFAMGIKLDQMLEIPMVFGFGPAAKADSQG